MDLLIIFHALLFIKLSFSKDRLSECKPYYHFWRPYTGHLPEDAWIGSERAGKVYIGKIIPLDSNSWSHAAQIDVYDFVDWKWPMKDRLRVDRFIEILCTKAEHAKKLHWRRLADKSDQQIALSYCCLVESGMMVHKGQTHFAYIGRKLVKGQFYVGPVFLKQDWYFASGLYTVQSGKSVFYPENFEILHYGCSKTH